MTTVDSNGIIRYQTTDPVSPLQTLLNLGMQSVSDAITPLKTGPVWVSYTPTFPGMTLGSSVTTGKYSRVGNIVHVLGRVSLQGSFAIAVNQTMNLPVTSGTVTGDMPLGLVTYTKSGVGYHMGWARHASTTTIQFVPSTAGASGIAPSIPFTFAANDSIYWNLTYEAA